MVELRIPTEVALRTGGRLGPPGEHRPLKQEGAESCIVSVRHIQIGRHFRFARNLARHEEELLHCHWPIATIKLLASESPPAPSGTVIPLTHLDGQSKFHIPVDEEG